jgi:hypothetical protein
MRTLQILDLVFYVVLFMFLSFISWNSFQEASWKDRCRDAGGVPTSNFVCVNPGSVIEVD